MCSVLSVLAYSNSNTNTSSVANVVEQIVASLDTKADGVYAISGYWSGHSDDFIGIASKKLYDPHGINQKREFGIFMDNHTNELYAFAVRGTAIRIRAITSNGV